MRGIMHQRMPLQLVWPTKPPPTPGVRTGKWPFTRMRADMFRQVARLDKPFIAVRADERAITIVRALVDRQARADGERLAAPGVVADEGLVVGVPAHVGGQRGRFGETLSANGTDVGAMAGVRLEVAQDLLARAEEAAFGAAAAVPVAPVRVAAAADVRLREVFHEVAGGGEGFAHGASGPQADVLRFRAGRRGRWRGRELDADRADVDGVVVVRAERVVAVRVGVGVVRRTRYASTVVRVGVGVGVGEDEMGMSIGVGLEQVRDAEVVLEQVAEHRLRRQLAVRVWMTVRVRMVVGLDVGMVVRVRILLRSMGSTGRMAVWLRGGIRVETDAERKAIIPQTRENIGMRIVLLWRRKAPKRLHTLCGGVGGRGRRLRRDGSLSVGIVPWCAQVVGGNVCE